MLRSFLKVKYLLMKYSLRRSQIRQIIFIMKYTYKKIITTKSIWFTMLMPVVLLVIISLVSKAQNTGNPAVVTSITPDQAKNFATQVLPRILTIFLYMVIITNSSVIATEIARDKGSKLLNLFFINRCKKKYFYGRNFRFNSCSFYEYISLSQCL